MLSRWNSERTVVVFSPPIQMRLFYCYCTFRKRGVCKLRLHSYSFVWLRMKTELWECYRRKQIADTSFTETSYKRSFFCCAIFGGCFSLLSFRFESHHFIEVSLKILHMFQKIDKTSRLILSYLYINCIERVHKEFTNTIVFIFIFVAERQNTFTKR